VAAGASGHGWPRPARGLRDRAFGDSRAVLAPTALPAPDGSFRHRTGELLRPPMVRSTSPWRSRPGAGLVGAWLAVGPSVSKRAAAGVWDAAWRVTFGPQVVWAKLMALLDQMEAN